MHVVRLSPTISHKIYQTGYERFRPNKHGYHLWRTVLPRRLAPVLPTTYSPSSLHLTKALPLAKHLESPYHAFAHCKGSVTAAPLRARTSISVSFLRPRLSSPLLIAGLVSLYLTNNLISRRLILRPCVSRKMHSSNNSLFSFILSFPSLS